MMKQRTKTALLIAGAAAIGAWAVKRRLTRLSFAGRTVIITGASRGLGLVLARQLARQGANLALVARTARDLRAAEDDAVSHGGEAISIPCDVRDQAEVEAAIALVIERFGRIDVLINNAGVIQVGPIDNMAMHDFEDAMATHFYGPLFTTLEVIPHMRRQGGGRIVNISSIGGKVAVPHLLPYCASKFALVGLSDGMRAELARDGIFVTTVCPWLMRTGSAFNVEVKGRHEREFAWFAWAATLPGVTMSPEKAARRIIEACRRGTPRLLLAPWGKLSAAANELTPGLMAGLQRFANRLLPKADVVDGDFPRSGWRSRSSLTPEPLLKLANRAALRNNEMQHAVRSRAGVKPTRNPSRARTA